MTLLPGLEESPLQQVYVALDLETTGVDPATDEIIEVGAVRFRGREALDTFTTPINPHRPLSPFIQRLTGITQEEVNSAPPFGAVSPQLVAFIGDAPLVGHNVSFDLAFLARRGLRFSSPVFDTRDLAPMLLPQGSYSLGSLTSALGVPHLQPHRALSDAQATHLVLVTLMEQALDLDPSLLGELHRLATVARWSLRYLLGPLANEAERRSPGQRAALGLGGLDIAALERRLAAPRARGRRTRSPTPISQEELADLLRQDGPLASILPGYEPRQEQDEMLKAVARAFQEGHHLVAEAGTGVGKTMAYLLPAALFSVRNNAQVVISTNTINLQEQLIHKDLPAVSRAMAQAGVTPVGGLRYTSLKGRTNYLCMRRWARLRSGDSLTTDEARLLGKLLIWLQDTTTGDRADLRMTRGDNSAWDGVSAQGSQECPNPEGPCFLRAAREQADAAQIVVVNHALLLSDLQRGGGLLPEHDYLIVDEAHHLEEVATRQFGFRITHREIQEMLDTLVEPRGLGAEAMNTYRTSKASSARRQATEEAVQVLTQAVDRNRGALGELFAGLARFLEGYTQGSNGGRRQLLVASGIRTQPDWSDIEVVGENARNTLGEVAQSVDGVHRSLDGLKSAELLNYDALRAEMVSQFDALQEVRDHLDQFFLRPDMETIYWAEESEAGGLSLHAAPLHVGATLKERLFNKKESVILTSATLTSAGSFTPIRGRLGLEEAEELLLGSPFDYPQAAMLCMPQDMPEPGDPTYGDTLAQAVVGLAQAAQGHTMALFTSHSALRAAATPIRAALEAQEIRVLAQGVDGAPRDLLEEFLENPQAVLLGTASFWEGVDLIGEALKVLVLARLPFDVPTEPVFAARSELFENPFQEYALPQAILRFRQGFGRLIRSKSDRGAVVVLDRRISSRSYGALFLRSLPPCTVARPQLQELPDTVARWLAG